MASEIKSDVSDNPWPIRAKYNKFIAVYRREKYKQKKSWL